MVATDQDRGSAGQTAVSTCLLYREIQT